MLTITVIATVSTLVSALSAWFIGRVICTDHDTVFAGYHAGAEETVVNRLPETVNY